MKELDDYLLKKFESAGLGCLFLPKTFMGLKDEDRAKYFRVMPLLGLPLIAVMAYTLITGSKESGSLFLVIASLNMLPFAWWVMKWRKFLRSNLKGK